MAKGDVRFSVNAQAAEYLIWLSKNTVLGRTANEVAANILIQRLAEMRQDEYRDTFKLSGATGSASD